MNKREREYTSLMCRSKLPLRMTDVQKKHRFFLLHFFKIKQYRNKRLIDWCVIYAYNSTTTNLIENSQCEFIVCAQNKSHIIWKNLLEKSQRNVVFLFIRSKYEILFTWQIKIFHTDIFACLVLFSYIYIYKWHRKITQYPCHTSARSHRLHRFWNKSFNSQRERRGREFALWKP